ncbi:MAG: hypothetical protein IJB71_05380 [Bacilli bacterium]|nr:hypothetical protein [Bacilli bacterium]
MFLDINCAGYMLPSFVGYFVSLVYNGIRIAIPILLIIMGMFDMGKAIVAKKEDDVKKAQSLLVKKIIVGVIVFLLPYLVNFIFGFLANDSSIMKCVMALLNYN